MCVFARTALAATVVVMLGASTAWAAVVTVTPTLDNSIFSDNPDRSCALGSLYAGKTGGFGSRRALLMFNVAANLPAGSTVTSVELTVRITRSGTSATPSDPFGLHRLQAEWGEKASLCTSGTGVLADPGDATWSHRQFATDAWGTAGGDFAAAESGSTALPLSGLATWTSQSGMVSDVQSWLSGPAGNFGWIVLGDETAVFTAREIGSREGVDPPSLRITYTPPLVTPPAVPDGQSGPPVLLGKLSSNGANLLVTWNTALCNGNAGHHLVYGTRAGFPPTLSGLYAVTGSVCGLGPSSPYTWIGSPDPAVVDPQAKLLWILVLADDAATTEGSWGRSNASQERNGTGANGSSAQCGILDKNVANACGIVP